MLAFGCADADRGCSGNDTVGHGCTAPKSVTTSIGKKAKFTVKAVGDGLTYQWYYKDTDGKKYKKASCTKATYSIELTKDRNGRKFYCVVTDKYGNEVKTKTVSMKNI